MLITSNTSYGTMLTMGNDFGEWLRQQREERSLTQAKLAEASKISRTIINKIENHTNFPTSETIKAIAIGLKIAPEEAFRAAGILSSVPKGDEQFERLKYIFTELPADERRALVDYGNFLLSKVEKSK